MMEEGRKQKVQIECKKHSTHIKGKINSVYPKPILALDMDAQKIVDVDCLLLRGEGRNNYGTKMDYSIEDCILYGLPLDQFKLFNQAESLIQFNTYRCLNPACGNLGIFSVYKTEEEYLKNGGVPLPKGLEIGTFFSKGARLLDSMLCASCNKKREERIRGINKQFGLE